MQKNKTVTFVTGTGFSGSGCVLDWLREQDGLTVSPSRPFSYYFRRRGKLKRFNSLNLVLKLLESQSTQERAELITNAIDFLNQFVSYRKSIHYSIKYIAKRINVIRQLKSLLVKGKRINFKRQKQLNPEIKSKYPGWENALEDILFLEHLNLIQDNPTQLLKAVSSWLEKRITLHDHEHLVFDKTFPTGSLVRAERLMSLLPQAKVVIVVRDVYDQLINAVLLTDTIDIDDNTALKTIMEKRLGSVINGTVYFSELKSKFPGRVFSVAFEEFVLNHVDMASQLGTLLDIPVSNKEYENLDLSISKKNIGLKNEYTKLTTLIDDHLPVIPAKESVAVLLEQQT